MYILKLLRFLAGYVVFTTSGGFPERFINLCAMKHIPVWDISYSEDSITGKTSIEGYKMLRLPARRSGVLPRVQRKCGLPFVIRKNSHRFGLVVGAALCVAVMCVLSCFLWSVEFSGNESIGEYELSVAAEQLGVKRGAYLKNIDVKAVSRELIARFPELMWAAVNIRGCHASVEVRERVMSPEMVDVDSPANVVAAYPGEIVEMQVFSGVATVKTGYAVNTGDLLISGVTENLDGSVGFRHADGYIIARTKRSISVLQPLKSDVMITEDVHIRKTFYFFGLKLPLGFGKRNAEKSSTVSYLSSGDTSFPIGVITDSYITYSQEKREFSERESMLFAYYGLFERRNDEMDEAKVLDYSVFSENASDGFLLKIDFVCTENIAKTVLFEVEDDNIVNVD